MTIMCSILNLDTEAADRIKKEVDLPIYPVVQWVKSQRMVTL